MQIRVPREITEAAAGAGAAKAKLTVNSLPRLMVASCLAGAYIALGGILSLIVGYGFPEITASNPSMQKLLSGCMFPIGLILVVILGAELFTGNNALLIPSYMKGSHNFATVIRNWVLVYVGNFIGAVTFTYILVYACGLTTADPYHSAIIGIAKAKVSMTWLTVFMKGIGANWCVCLAVWLALSGKTLFEKALGCWLPVMAFVALGYEHSIANMFFIPLGMMEGAEVGIGEAITANLIPATLGNIVGGALLVGAVNAYLHEIKRK
ncbi:MAG: formate/nitrite transporter family protein [Bacteroides sp.]|nr:formate/nitrite transporter family protein [Bacteroides sp.]